MSTAGLPRSVGRSGRRDHPHVCFGGVAACADGRVCVCTGQYELTKLSQVTSRLTAATPHGESLLQLQADTCSAADRLGLQMRALQPGQLPVRVARPEGRRARRQVQSLSYGSALERQPPKERYLCESRPLRNHFSSGNLLRMNLLPCGLLANPSWCTSSPLSESSPE